MNKLLHDQVLQKLKTKIYIFARTKRKCTAPIFYNPIFIYFLDTSQILFDFSLQQRGSNPHRSPLLNTIY